MDRQLLLGKQEVTYGVAPALTAADSMWAENVKWKPAALGRVRSSPAKPGVGRTKAQVYGQYVTFEFEVPLVGSGVAGTAPKWGPVFPACGWLETVVPGTSVTYAPMPNPTATAKSMSFKWRDGERRQHMVSGWKGTASFKLSAGGRPMIMFKGKAIYADPTESAAELTHADMDITGWLDAKPVASGTTLFSFAGISGLGLRDFTINQNDTVNFLSVPEQENVRHIGERTFDGAIKITNPKPSILNLASKWKNSALEVFSMTHDTTAGRIVTINGRTQLSDVDYAREKQGDGGGDGGDDVASANHEMAPSTLTTDDEISLVLT